MPRKSGYVIAAAAIAAAILAYFLMGGSSCTVKQLALEQDIKKYQSSQDPESCVAINERISDYDSQCRGTVDALDCG